MLNRALDIVASCRVSLDDGDDILVNGQGQTLIVKLPTLRTGLKILRFQPVRRYRRQWIEWLSRLSHISDLDLRIELAGSIVARLGRHAQPGFFSWVCGVKPMEFHPIRMVVAGWKERNATRAASAG